jgi:hypothetical protein
MFFLQQRDMSFDTFCTYLQCRIPVTDIATEQVVGAKQLGLSSTPQGQVLQATLHLVLREL